MSSLASLKLLLQERRGEAAAAAAESPAGCIAEQHAVARPKHFGSLVDQIADDLIADAEELVADADLIDDLIADIDELGRKDTSGEYQRKSTSGEYQRKGTSGEAESESETCSTMSGTCSIMSDSSEDDGEDNFEAVKGSRFRDKLSARADQFTRKLEMDTVKQMEHAKGSHFRERLSTGIAAFAERSERDCADRVKELNTELFQLQETMLHSPKSQRKVLKAEAAGVERKIDSLIPVKNQP